MSQETVSSSNWREFNTCKRWISQCQRRSDDKVIPEKTEESMDNWIRQFIESSKTNYAIQKGTQASNEYVAIITPYVNQIVSL